MDDMASYPVLSPVQISADVRRVPSVQEMLQQQEILRGVIESISSELELRPLLTRIVRHACELLDAWDGGIGLFDPKRGVIRMEATHNMPEDELGTEFEAGVGLAGQVLAARRIVSFQSYRQVPSPSRRDRNEFAVLGVPIAWHDRLIGFFGLGAPMPRQFDAIDAEVLQLFGRHAAIAIQNARRYEREQHRARRWAMVARIGRMATSGLDLKTLLQNAANEIHESLGYANVAIPLLDEQDPSRLVIEILGGRYRQLLSGTHYLPIDQGIMGAAVRERRVQRVDNVHADARYFPTPGAEGIRAELATPILLGNEVLGVLNVESEEPFTDDDASSLRVVADHLALAVQNSRLFDRAQRLTALEQRQSSARLLQQSAHRRLGEAVLAAESLAELWQRDPVAGARAAGAILEKNQEARLELSRVLAEQELGASTSQAPPKDSPAIGLATRLSEIVEELETKSFRIQLQTTDYAPMPAAQEDVLFRITREALENVVRHAQASVAIVRLRLDARFAYLEVLDDGVGWPDPSASRPMAGRGLRDIGMWAGQLGGQVDFVNRRARGAAVRVVLPNPAVD